MLCVLLPFLFKTNLHNLTAAPWSGYNYYPHFSGEEVEAQPNITQQE